MRQSLGSCYHGRLFLKPCRRAGGIDLYWTGSLPNTALSDELKALIEMCAMNLSLRTHIRLPPVQPMPVRAAVYWLARLAPGQYVVEEQIGGGCELYEVERVFPDYEMRRPGAA